MNLNGFLGSSFQAKYNLSDRDVSTLEFFISVLRENYEVRLKGSSLLERFDSLSEVAYFNRVQSSEGVFGGFLQLHNTRVHPREITEIFHEWLTEQRGLDRVALVLITEIDVRWLSAGEDLAEAEEPVEGGEDEPSEARAEMSRGTWLQSGQYPYDNQFHDLNTVNVNEPGVPVPVQVAAMFYSARNKDGDLIPSLLEQVSDMLGQALVAEMHKAASPNRPTSALWPTNTEHWIFGDEAFNLHPVWPVPAGTPLRDKLIEDIRTAAKFSLARTSGQGTTRIFNLEGFISNMIFGLIGSGAPGDVAYDWRAMVDQYLPVAEAVVAEDVTAGTNIELGVGDNGEDEAVDTRFVSDPED
jgi:hypothetical protein